MDLVEEFAPSLRDEWLTLQPFQDVINGASAGPQPQCKHHDMDDPQWIELDFSTWDKGEITESLIWRIVKKGKVTEGYAAVVVLEHEGEIYDSSLEQLWDYLRQLPRPAVSFTAGIDQS